MHPSLLISEFCWITGVPMLMGIVLTNAIIVVRKWCSVNIFCSCVGIR